MGGCGSDPSYQAGGGGAGAGAGVDVGAVVGALGGLWGSLAEKTKTVAAAAHEELKQREIGKKVKEGLSNTLEATKQGWQENVDEETRGKLRNGTVSEGGSGTVSE